MSRKPRIPYPQPNDPLVNLPALCIDLIFSYFSPVELIGFQRVHPIWKNEVNWRFNRTTQWKRWFPLLRAEDKKEYANPEEAALAFRRVLYRHEMCTRGEPTVIRKFTGASQGWTVCGDYFVWVDTDAINIQLIFNIRTPGQMARPVRRFPLRDLFRQVVSGRSTQIKSLYAQVTGVGGEQPLLGIVFASQADAWPYSINRVTVMDVVQRKALWCVTERKGYAHHCTLNQGSLAYIQHICQSPDSPYINHHYHPQDSLKVLNVLTGVFKSSTKLPQNIPECEITEVRAHPVRELIFVTLRGEILVLCTATAAWVGVLKFPTVCTTNQTIRVSNPFPTRKVELRFDEYGRGSGGHNTISICKVAHFMHLGKFRLRCWVVYHFEFPTVEELKVDNTEITEDKLGGGSLKFITNWKSVVDVIECTNATVSGHPWINLRSKQTGEFLRGASRSTKVFINTFKESIIPEDLEGIHLTHAGPVHQFPTQGKGREKETEAEIKWFSLSGQSEVTKMKKDLPKDTPYAERRAPFCFSSRKSESPQLSERYLIVDQGSEVLLFSFEPAW